MHVDQKLNILRHVESSGLPVRKALARLDVPVSTYYRWRRNFHRFGVEGLSDKSTSKGKGWNRLLPEERETILDVSRDEPQWSCREVACFVTDNKGFSVSESSVYRLLKRMGLVKPRDVRIFPAGPEYHTKTRRPNQQWQTDSTYILVKNWGGITSFRYSMTSADAFSHGSFNRVRTLMPSVKSSSSLVMQPVWMMCPSMTGHDYFRITGLHSSPNLLETIWRPKASLTSSRHHTLRRQTGRLNATIVH